MRIGVMVMPTDRSMPPDELAVAVEQRGLKSLFLPEHTHIPTSRVSPYPGGGELKEGFQRVIDPMIGLAMAAAVTEHIELGTGVMLVNQHDPITLAKQISTLDHFSGGRFVLGGGFGWNAEEMAHHGVDPKRRRTVFRDKILAMKQLWTCDEAEYSGEYVSFSSSWQWPKPARKPHPPILLGGAAGPVFFRHIVEYADGWIPIGGSGLREDLQTLHATAEEAGRDPKTLSVSVFGAKPEKGSLEYYQQLGVERVALALPAAQRFNEVREATKDEILPVLDEYAQLAAHFED